MIVQPPRLFFELYPSGAAPAAAPVGFRFGARGTHSSRTMMFEELDDLLESVPGVASRNDYAVAIIEGNCLSKRTLATRRLTNQRLGELYGLDSSVPLFGVMRRLWEVEPLGKPLLAILAVIARDPLLAATCASVVRLPIGSEFQREPLRAALRSLVGHRLNERVLEKVGRNVASSWTQSGHLQGRTMKKRQMVTPTPSSAAFAIYLAHAAGYRGAAIFSSGWFQTLDCDPSRARSLALEAKQLSLIDLRMAGDVVEFNLSRLDPLPVRR